MCRDCRSAADRELKNCCSCASQDVSPEDWVNVGCLGMSVAGVFLTAEASVFRILEPDHKSLHLPLNSLFHINKHPSAAVGQPIQGVNVVDKDDVTADLQLQHSLEWGVPDSPRAVDVELLH